MIKLSKKNILFFILGFLAYFVIDFVSDWDNNIKDVTRGFKEGYEDARR